ncbi:MAG: hypothetical protein MR902_03790 [Campylobacter sp.]|nr:hypothetical protein [Campylobacter sp.]
MKKYLNNMIIKLGDIVKQRVDYSLNPSNTEMILRSGVSMALLEIVMVWS